MKIKYFITLLISGCLLFSISGCLKKDPQASIAQVLLVPLSPNSSPVDFSVNGVLFATTVGYSTTVGTVRYTLPYYTIEPKGTTTISYNLTGTTTSIASVTRNIEADKVYSTFLIDSVHEAKAVIVNDNLSDPTSGKVKIRFFHFSGNTSPVDVVVTGSTSKLFVNRSFNDQVSSPVYENFIEMDPGTYTFSFINTTTGATVYTTTSQVLIPDRIYTLAIRGFTGGTTTQSVGAWVYPNKP
ncbi:MAG: DUF4397 domain-containing protein [Ferruginibacter sp.]